MSDASIYAEQLAHLCQGYALYDPNPKDRDHEKVQLGDIGYIEDGAFVQLFNIFTDGNRVGGTRPVPDNFSSLPIHQRDQACITCLSPGLWTSEGMEIKETDNEEIRDEQ